MPSKKRKDPIKVTKRVKYQVEIAAGKPHVFTFQWHITDLCNLKCTHCYTEDQLIRDLPTKEALQTVDNIAYAMEGLRVYGSVGITGGEPFVRKDLFEILSRFKEKHLEGYPFGINIMTNGTLLTQELLTKLLAYSPPVNWVQVSIDGATEETNDTIRGQGNFERALNGIRRVKSETKLGVTASFTVHKANVQEVPKLIELCIELDVDAIQIRRLVPIGRGTQFSETLLSPEQTRHLITFLYRKEREFEEWAKNGKKAPILIENRGLFHLADPKEAVIRYSSPEEGKRRLGNRCAIGFSTITILPDGTVLPCRVLPIPIGNILKQDFIKDIWYGSELLWNFRTRDKHIKGKCQRCTFTKKYKDLCCGGSACVSWGYYGDYEMPDPQCWYEPP